MIIVVGQFDPSKSLFRVLVPGQHPNTPHGLVITVVVVVGALVVMVVGQFDPSESLFRVLVPGQHPNVPHGLASTVVVVVGLVVTVVGQFDP